MEAAHQQAEAEQVQEEADELLAKTFEVLRTNCQSPAMRSGQVDFHTVAAVMAPIALELARANSAIRRLEQASARAESFQALVAATLVKQSQRIHDLEQLQPAGLSSAPSSPVSHPLPAAQRQPSQHQLSPMHEAKQQMVAQKQMQQRQERMINMPAASRTLGLRPLHAAAVPSSSNKEARGERLSCVGHLCSCHLWQLL